MLHPHPAVTYIIKLLFIRFFPKPLHLGPGFRISCNLLMQTLQSAGAEIIVGCFIAASVEKPDSGQFVLGLLIKPPSQDHCPTQSLQCLFPVALIHTEGDNTAQANGLHLIQEAGLSG